ncbi:pilus assembly protein TadG-related protein [Kocuria indica]|uniref:pilus assembly protein TadG-related protein n=1 Tax=Kocuria marina TaxID=223184 RepID=UPI001EF477BE|nr:pilus assembly protein TadG-related protein [Kocuria indica]MCG7431462.1 pilus assembly protein TadG-related protein [Kocuria indica]
MLSGRDVMRPLIGIATAQIDDLDGPRPHECPAQGTSQDRDEPHRANPEDPDSGQTTIVMIGFALVTLLLVITVMAITSVYVGERQLQSLADRAAGAAADTFTNVDRSGSGPPTPILTNGAVAASATSYLGTVGAFHDVSGLSLAAPTGSADGTTAQVTLSAVVHPPVVNVFIPAGVPISATGDARAVMQR